MISLVALRKNSMKESNRGGASVISADGKVFIFQNYALSFTKETNFIYG